MDSSRNLEWVPSFSYKKVGVEYLGSSVRAGLLTRLPLYANLHIHRSRSFLTMRFSVAIVIALFFSPFVLALPVNDPPSTPPPPPSSDKGKGKEKAEKLTPSPESTGGQSEHSSSSGGLDLGRGHPDVGKVKLFPLASYVSALHGSMPNLMQCL
jgi:hypothetical protein